MARGRVRWLVRVPAALLVCLGALAPPMATLTAGHAAAAGVAVGHDHPGPHGALLTCAVTGAGRTVIEGPERSNPQPLVLCGAASRNLAIGSTHRPARTRCGEQPLAMARGARAPPRHVELI
ncbi:MAG TPA: hypothetical protein VE442_05415 [Jatrophihabitans sp.]|nr:hypothetical protein [Jatrophihabitans sp.]